VWGKRRDDDVTNDQHDAADSDDDDVADVAAEKRKWIKNTVRVWGKRLSDDDLLGSAEDVDKRRWSKNTVRVWGKKRSSTSDVAGLSSPAAAASAFVGRNDGVKRRWADNRVRVWGKRQSPGQREDAENSWEEPDVEDDDSSNIDKLRQLIKSLGQINDSAQPQQRQFPVTSSVAGDAGGDDVDDDVTEKRSSIVKRAIEEHGRRSGWHERPWFVKRANPVEYGRNHFYPAEGPKRSWRTNVIRVWGKRTSL
jgi:hypothetical protein